MSSTIQTTFRRPASQLDPFLVGQIANTLPSKCESGVLSTADAVPFGRAVMRNGAETVTGGAGRLAYGALNANITSSVTSLVIKDQRAGARDLIGAISQDFAGDRLMIGSEILHVNGVTAGGRGSNQTVGVTRGQDGTSGASHTANAEVYLMNAGLSDFAGVAVRNVALPGDNSPVDSYNQHDIVTIGSAGDFVVEVDAAVAMNDAASVNISTASNSANFGKFSKSAESATSIAIPGAIFMSASRTVNGKLVAVLRITKQTG